MARLPEPGGDENVWGDILNNFLSQQHSTDGTHNVAAILKVPAQTGRVLTSNVAMVDGVGWKLLNQSDVGLANVSNTSDADKPISNLQQAALDTKISKTSAIALMIAL